MDRKKNIKGTKLNNLSKYDITIIGGAGHVGLPLGIAFANKKLKVCLLDTNKKNLNIIKKSQMPFIEYGANKILKKVIKNKIVIMDR